MRMAGTVLLALALALPARADDVEDAIDAALQAYRADDIKTAREELAFASQLLDKRKAGELQSLLPDPLPGWQREDDDSGQSPAMAAFGGGQMAGARYTKDDDAVEIQLMADNPMVAAMGAMFSNTAMMGAMGEVKRLGGEKVVLTQEGELQSLVDGRIMVMVSGSADPETLQAYFEAIDLDKLKAF